MTIDDLIISLKKGNIPDENSILEYKKSKKSLSNSLWETFSAFANTAGGIIICGIDEKRINQNVSYIITGVENAHIQEEDFWNRIKSDNKLNSLSWISHDILRREYIDGKEIILISVSESLPNEKPVTLNNQLSNSYIRNGTSDNRMNNIELKKFLIDNTLNIDNHTIPYYGIDEVNLKSVANYRAALLKDEKLKHIALEKTDEEFLKAIGAMARDTNTGNLYLTNGGLLFFGKRADILQIFPEFQLDFFDKSDITETRYNNRISTLTDTDNIFDFFMEVLNTFKYKYSSPFELSADQKRTDNSESLLTSLREALVNTLMHADYALNNSHVEIIMNSNNIVFSNPGRMLVTQESFFTQTKSIVRNGIISSLFVMAGYGERAGTGGTVIKNIAINNNLKFPELTIHNFDTSIKIWKSDFLGSINDVELSENARLILKLINNKLMVKRSTVEEELKLTKKEAITCLNMLKNKKYIQVVGNGRSTHYTLPMSDTQLIAMLQMTTDTVRKQLRKER
ncbi:RNA-binding domain-containing protein [Latilactobacillus sakei]|uniref:RNA-binding domain-containing protein n=1 Tax=Latilactobacillus sakei TaxID=1599 RepID=UPI00077C3C14|nr:RNA-binding domain-containing protein [Latilactobacillus sakei]